MTTAGLMRLFFSLVILLVVGAVVFLYRVAPRGGSDASPVQFTHSNFPTIAHKHNDSDGFGYSGATVFDANGDELPDLFLGSGRGAKDRLLIQTRSGWETRGLDASTGHTYAVLSVDLNRDFVPDLVVSRDNGTFLYINDGNGGFRDATPKDMATPMAKNSVALALAAGDVNRDGWVDLYEGRFTDGRLSRAAVADNPGHAGKNRLWINLGRLDAQGRPQFRDATAQAGVAGCCNTFAAVLVDLDDDGDQDLALANDTGPVEVFDNDGHGRFQKRTTGLSGYGVWMGIAVGDYDGDGDMDLFFTNKGRNIPDFLFTGEARNGQPFSGDYLLARNDGGLRFTDVTREAGLDNWGFARGAAWLDMDNDGRLDLSLVGNSIRWPLSRFLPHPGRLFYQYQRGAFVDVAVAAGAANAHYGTSPVIADLNRDGFPDLVLVNRKGPVRVLINRGNRNHWLGIRLRGRDNASTLGTRVVLHLKDGTRLTRQHIAGEGFMVDHDNELLFGVGRRTQIDSIRIYWASGKYTRFEGQVLDRHIGFVEPSDAAGGRNIQLREPMLEMLKKRPTPTRKPLQCS